MWQYILAAETPPLVPEWIKLTATALFFIASTVSTVLWFFAKRELKRVDVVVTGFPPLVTVVETLAKDVMREVDERSKVDEQIWTKLNKAMDAHGDHKERCREVYVSKDVLEQVMKLRDTQDTNLSHQVVALSQAVKTLDMRVDRIRSP